MPQMANKNPEIIFFKKLGEEKQKTQYNQYTAAEEK